MVSKEVEKLLLKVQKPGRYVGGELNEVIKRAPATKTLPRFACVWAWPFPIPMK